ncbi:MAG: sensor histidine kinase [Romboutsia sp.]|uniref:sensor histidine kinase n=1 Tax=Romboutsia sp. TaxID=1965302 RepID=UPI003F39C1BB
MKGKLIIYYSVSFILACLVIVFINVAFMRSSIYREGALYNYHPEKMISSFKNYIYEHNENILVNEEGLNILDKNNIGMQILDGNNNEVFSYNKPIIAPAKYSNTSLINMYSNRDETLFVDEVNIDNGEYTYLLFWDSDKIKRVTYSYDVKLVEKAHRFPTLITINTILILIISFLYTLKITKPINRITNKIFNLSNGDYSRYKAKAGIYYEVEESLNQLSDRLSNNEEEREKLEVMREEWISNISHDIKTPLTSIIGNAEIIEDTEYEIDTKTIRRCCTTIINKSEYIKTLVEDLNLSTRLKNNNLTLNKKQVNIVSLIRHVLIDIINDEKYNDHNIRFTYSDSDIFLQLDKDLINRVFVNIIINAFVHNNSDVKINIDIQNRNNGNIEVTIEDDGKGVSEDELNNIFRRYYRGTNTKKKIEGSGLGMAIAHDIIKVHGGDINATSKLGSGLKITIVFYQ